MTARTVGTEASRVEGAAEFRLVLWMPRQVPEFVDPVCELTLVPILAAATLLKGTTQLGLVATGVGLSPPLLGRGFADAAVEFLVLLGLQEDGVVHTEGETDVRVVQLSLLLVSSQET